MITREKIECIHLPKEIYSYFPMDKILFFDIETTGFDKEKSNTILISNGHFVDKDRFLMKQYFAESLQEERKILLSFKEDVKKFNIWCSYNGIAFDEPFIKKRMAMKEIEFFKPDNHMDLYRGIRPYHKQLGMERCNLKTVESYLGIQRKDEIDGGLSVELYYEFLDSRDSNLREIIMLHNYEDVLNLPKIFKLIYEIENNHTLKRENAITEKQCKYLKYLLKNNEIALKKDIDKISKKAASRIIHNILKGLIDVDEFNNIIDNSY